MQGRSNMHAEERGSKGWRVLVVVEAELLIEIEVENVVVATREQGNFDEGENFVKCKAE